MERKPLIGLAMPADAENGRLSLSCAYVRAVAEAGGIPVCLVPEREETLLRCALDCDGLLLTGGGDISPAVFGVTSDLCRGVDEARDAFELSLCRAFMREGKPVFGICRGAQLLNTAAGGTLFFDIPGHSQGAPRDAVSHTVAVSPGSRLFSAVGEARIPVNSFHHQAVRDAAPGFRVSALAEDGTAEAIEHETRFWLGVQWHPECLYQNQPSARALFCAFVTEAAKRGQNE